MKPTRKCGTCKGYKSGKCKLKNKPEHQDNWCAGWKLKLI